MFSLSKRQMDRGNGRNRVPNSRPVSSWRWVDYLFGYREHVGYHVVLQSCSVQASPLEL
jgi:hypothetical protein